MTSPQEPPPLTAADAPHLTAEELTFANQLAQERGVNPLRFAHALRFRRISTRYPLAVSDAYDGDLAAAQRDDDAAVAARVAAWEQREGRAARDWVAMGREEEREPGEQ
jgi:hypothetical protein